MKTQHKYNLQQNNIENTESRTHLMIFFNESHLKLELDEASRTLLAEWHGFSTSSQFRAGLAQGLEIIAKHKVVNWLADIREAKVVSVADQDYMAQEWTVSALEKGLKRMAYVVPRSALTQIALNRIVDQTQGLEIKYFAEVEAARQWLLSFNS